MMLRTVLCALAYVLSATGCSGGAATTDAATTDSGAAFDLLTRSGSYDRVNKILVSAEHRLVTACMATQGLPYLAEPAQRTDAVTIDDRRETGYGLYTRYAGAPTQKPANDAYVQGLPAAERVAYQRALEGGDDERRAIRLSSGATVSFPGGGCLGQAYRELYGDVVEWARITYVPQALHLSMAKRVENEPEYRSAIRAWSTCMDSRALPAATPESAQAELQNLYEQQGPSEELRAREVSTAVTDWECAEQVHLPEIVVKIKKRLVAESPAVDRKDLARLADAWTAAAARTQH